MSFDPLNKRKTGLATPATTNQKAAKDLAVKDNTTQNDKKQQLSNLDDIRKSIRSEKATVVSSPDPIRQDGGSVSTPEERRSEKGKKDQGREKDLSIYSTLSPESGRLSSSDKDFDES